jgi:hypothetical protein
MSQIIRLEERRRKAPQPDSPIVKKLIDGEIVEYVDFEMLSLDQQVQLLDSNSNRRSYLK